MQSRTKIPDFKVQLMPGEPFQRLWIEQVSRSVSSCYSTYSSLHRSVLQEKHCNFMNHACVSLNCSRGYMKRWKALRERFVRERKKIKTKTGDPAKTPQSPVGTCEAHAVFAGFCETQKVSNKRYVT